MWFRLTGHGLQHRTGTKEEALETENTKRPFALTDLFSLYLRPRRFAAQVEDAMDDTYWTLFFAWVVGVASTVERIDTRISQSELAGRSVPFLSLEWIQLVVQLLDPRLYRWRDFWGVFLVSRGMVVPDSIAIFWCDERLCDRRTRLVDVAIRCGHSTSNGSNFVRHVR